MLVAPALEASTTESPRAGVTMPTITAFATPSRAFTMPHHLDGPEPAVALSASVERSERNVTQFSQRNSKNSAVENPAESPRVNWYSKRLTIRETHRAGHHDRLVHGPDHQRWRASSAKPWSSSKVMVIPASSVTVPAHVPKT